MEDIEKVIQALEKCLKYEYSCDKCPYKTKFNDEEKDCSIELEKDALELLKEQKKELDFYKEHEHEVCVNCPIDEKNVVKPKRGFAWTQKAWFCGECGFRLNMAGKYCAKCGKPIDWDSET